MHRILAPLLMLLTIAVPPALAEKRVALVVGNSEYVDAGHLKNPRNDADAVAAVLKRLGFTVHQGIDADQQELKTLVRDFARDSEGSEVALFFYAGHAIQLNGRNYLLPVDANLEHERDVDFEALDMNLVLRQMERRDGTSIVLLDACRNNPFSVKLARSMGHRSASVGTGLAQIETGIGTFIGFATEPNKVAYDGEGKHSPFTQALLKHIDAPGVDIDVVMRRVRDDVIRLTGGLQVPWSNSSLLGDQVVLNRAAAVEGDIEPLRPTLTIKPGRTQSAPETDTGNGSDSEHEVELAYWNSISESEDPRLFEAYLGEYPEGRFASIARIRIERLGKAQPSEAEGRDDPGQDATAEAIEEGFWIAAKTSGDVSLFGRYLEMYPNGTHAEEARKLIDEKSVKEAALPPSVDVPLPKPKPAISRSVSKKPAAKNAAKRKSQPVKRAKTATKRNAASKRPPQNRHAHGPAPGYPHPEPGYGPGPGIGFGPGGAGIYLPFSFGFGH